MKKYKSDDKIVLTLKQHEGFARHPYRCTGGFLSVGYGRNLDTKGVTRYEAHYLLMNDLEEALHLTLDNIPVAKTLSENRLGVLVMMVFNLGLHGVLKFKKMLSALEKGDYNEAARCMLDSLWSKQVGSRSHELAEIMLTDKF